MLRHARRKRFKTKLAKASPNKNEIPQSNSSDKADLSSYVLVMPKSKLQENVLLEISVPDASLECGSMCSGSNNRKEKENSFQMPALPISEADSLSKVTPKKTKHICDQGSKISNDENVARTKKVKSKQVNSRKLTDYFKVRRSNRKTLLQVMQERQKVLENAILSGKEEGFEIKEFPCKGRGVISNRLVRRGDFVLEYAGELVNYEEAKNRELKYAVKENIGCYMYFFKVADKRFCVDATKETGRLGRLINHSKKESNLKTEPVFIDGVPHLALIAATDIQPGMELLYDYGDRSKKALESHPWLAS